MKLIHDGPAAYHPATGLDLVQGEHDYPDDKTEALLAAGLRKAKTTTMPAAKSPAREEER